MFKLKKTILYCLITIFCMSLYFESYALSNLDLTGVKITSNSKYKIAPTGANFYTFNKKGDSGTISTRISLNNCTLRFYIINKNQKNNATISIYRYKNGKKTKWKTINMKKNFMQSKDFSTPNSPFSSYTYEIVLEKGSDVDIAVTSFDLTDRSRKEHKNKKYDWYY